MIKCECIITNTVDEFRFVQGEQYELLKAQGMHLVFFKRKEGYHIFNLVEFNKHFVIVIGHNVEPGLQVSEITSTSASEKQIAGSHYSKLKIQPMKYCLENDLNYAQSNAIKYVTRYKDKNGIEDLKKAIHCLELLIQHEEGGL